MKDDEYLATETMLRDSSYIESESIGSYIWTKVVNKLQR